MGKGDEGAEDAEGRRGKIGKVELEIQKPKPISISIHICDDETGHWRILSYIGMPNKTIIDVAR